MARERPLRRHTGQAVPVHGKRNDLFARPPDDLADEDEALYEERRDAFEQTYFAPVDGAIPEE